MAESKIKFGTNTDVTISLSSLGIDGYRQSLVVDNSSDLYLDVMLGGSTRVGAVTVDGFIDILAYATWDGGTNYSGGLDGTDLTVTWGTTPSTSSILGFLQLMRLGIVNVDATDDDNEIEWGPFSVAAAFGGNLPRKWGIVIKNATDIALHATQGVTALKFDPITFTTA